MAIKYFAKAYRAYIYFRNPKKEDITFYRAFNAAFMDYIETRQSS